MKVEEKILFSGVVVQIRFEGDDSYFSIFVAALDPLKFVDSSEEAEVLDIPEEEIQSLLFKLETMFQMNSAIILCLSASVIETSTVRTIIQERK